MNEIEYVTEKFGILDYSPVGMCLMNSNYTILLWNKCLKNWTGVSKKNIVGENLFEFYPHLEQAKYKRRIDGIFTGGAPVIFSSQLHNYLFPSLLPDGTYRCQHTTITSLPAYNPKEFYALFAIEDVTELTKQIYKYRALHDKALKEIENRKKIEKQIKIVNTELEQRVIERTEDLQKANEKISKALEKEFELGMLKSRFISMISHEYRTPLTVILTSSYLLDMYFKKGQEDKFTEHIKKIQTSVDVMTSLLEEILIIRRAEESNMSFIPSIVDIIKLSKDILEEIKLIDNGKHKFEFEPNISDRNIKSDSNHLRLILINLLLNAIKYSPYNSTISLKLLNEEHNIIIKVIDNGFGIEPEEQNNIFEPFYRGEKYIGVIKGTGLGLTIVKKCISILGGNISLQSNLGQGTTFSLQIPKNPDENVQLI